MTNGKKIGAAAAAVVAIGTGVVIWRTSTSTSTTPAPEDAELEVRAAPSPLDLQVQAVLTANHFTGTVEASLPQRLGRPLNPKLASLGQTLWFDKFIGLNNDNTCGGCHSPTNAMGDTQSIAIGIQNNNIVGPGRKGPRNMRKAPQVINSPMFPNLMLNSRFVALSGDPFNNHPGWLFPPPEGLSLSFEPTLITAQAFIPPTEQTEMAGFTYSDHDVIRAHVIERLNSNINYRQLFGALYPAVKAGGPIVYQMFAEAIAEFEFSLVFTNSPLDRFARGELSAMTDSQKQGTLLFFGAAKCIQCHAVSGGSNEMFSDFHDHVLGVPQLVPSVGNVTLDGPNHNEDYGLEDFTSLPADRYKFRTPPIRNCSMQPAFFHDGAFTSLADAIRFHLNVIVTANAYTPASQHIAADLSGPMGPLAPILARLDPIVVDPIVLTPTEFGWLLDFVANGILDPRARPQNLHKLVPSSLPSGMTPMQFQF